ncbi:MAG: glutamate--tRNA ligase [Deltaproteobacteria bacterium]|nr:glutamate--tRNA ligase [Deltaproteobacteria bacterium]MCL5277534.1 glutamate--tRNA ligase [Deltaproteobacteria bacterium]
MVDEVRVRFAPSPTGYLHIGGARTALFNYLFARHNGGRFVLRIEDTDRERSTQESVDAIINGLTWLGLKWDEGPFYQSGRTGLYNEHVARLLERGRAYRCYCTPEELESKRTKALAEKRKPIYDRTCRERKACPADRPYVVRFKSPLYGTTAVRDMVKGNIVFNNEEIEDFVILRSDGSPTYNFVVVVDDVDMRITHVIRGDDHLNNTPKQIFLYNAFDYPIPRFAHIPLIHGADRARLSKRHGATSVEAYRDEGYLPEALVNYLVRLGWSFGDKEVFTMQEMIDNFSFDSVSRSAAVFNPEKLLWLNGTYIRARSAEELLVLLRPFLESRGLSGAAGGVNHPGLARLVDETKIRSRTLVELLDMMDYYFKEDIEYDPNAAGSLFTADRVPHLENVLSRLTCMDPFSREGIERAIKGYTSESGLKLGDVAQPLRLAVTGRTVSPGLFEIMEIIGKKEVLKRIENAIRYIKTLAQA